MLNKKVPRIEAAQQETASAESMATATAWAMYLGDAYRKAHKVLRPDEIIMANAIDYIQAKDAAAASGGNLTTLMRIINAKGQDGKPTPPTDEQVARAQAVAMKRQALRKAIAPIIPARSGATWDDMRREAQRPSTLRRIAATLHALGVHGEPPPSLAIPGRRPLTDAEMDRKAKAAEAWAQEAVG